MRCEIPVFDRAFCCLPLRYGVILLGYLTLMYSLLELGVLVFAEMPSETFVMYHGVGMRIRAWLAVTMYAVEVIFVLTLLVGAHRKDERLMRVFLYYGVTTSLASFTTFFVVGAESGYWEQYIVIEGAVLFSALVLQVYLLLMIHSELHKLKQQKQLKVVNNAAILLEVP